MLELDVRVLPPPKKHLTIHEMLDKLAPGEALRITNDHDPRPLKFELDHDEPNTYSFNYLESGPTTWLVDIVKRTETPAEPSLQLLAKSHGVAVSTASLEAGASLPSQKIGETIAIIVASGKLFVETPNGRRLLKAGDVQIVAPQMPHSIEAVDTSLAYVAQAGSPS
jgi:uncharacterized protein (DUF2249 family)